MYEVSRLHLQEKKLLSFGKGKFKRMFCSENLHVLYNTHEIAQQLPRVRVFQNNFV